MNKSIFLSVITSIFSILNSNCQLKVLSNGSTCGGQTAGALRIETSYRYVDIGCKNSNGAHTHHYTNAAQGYWFDKELMTGNGEFCSYQSNLTLKPNDVQHFIIMQSNGNCGIGLNYLPDAAFKLDVNGNIAVNHVQINSDIRLKRNLETLSDSKVNKLYSLQGWTYYLNQPAAVKSGDVLFTSDTLSNTSELLADTVLNVGFIAQEVRELFPELVKERENGYLTIDMVSLIPVMVEALKEQKAKLEELEEFVHSNLKPDEKAGESLVQPNETASHLFQNNPNPFYENTEIEYFIPNSVLNASLYIYDMQGKQIRSIKIDNRERGRIMINGNELRPECIFTRLLPMIRSQVQGK